MRGQFADVPNVRRLAKLFSFRLILGCWDEEGDGGIRWASISIRSMGGVLSRLPMRNLFISALGAFEFLTLKSMRRNQVMPNFVSEGKISSARLKSLAKPDRAFPIFDNESTEKVFNVVFFDIYDTDGLGYAVKRNSGRHGSELDTQLPVELKRQPAWLSNIGQGHFVDVDCLFNHPCSSRRCLKAAG